MKNLYRLGLAVALGLPALHLAAQPVAPAAPYTLRLAVGDVLPPANAAEWLRQPATSPADAWQGRVFRSAEDVITLPEFGFSCRLGDLYKGTPVR